jgi:dethiobiotin synthetase
MTRGFFITATDTDIGKTWVSRMLAIHLADSGRKVAYFKPVQTGCAMTGTGVLDAPDFDFVKQCGKLVEYDQEKCSPYRFVPAVSPHLAARLADTEISIDYIAEKFRSASEKSDCILVEGAGGLYAPVTESIFMIDIADSLKLPVILVCSPKLGTINHTVLSIKSLKERGLRLAGVIINDRHDMEKNEMFFDNCRFITLFANASPACLTGANQESSKSITEFCDVLARTWL